MRFIIDLLFAIVQWVTLFVIQLIGIILGLVVVPIGLLFPVRGNETKYFTQYKKNLYWYYKDVPFKWWSNPEDGLIGDHRGEWAMKSLRLSYR